MSVTSTGCATSEDEGATGEDAVSTTSGIVYTTADAVGRLVYHADPTGTFVAPKSDDELVSTFGSAIRPRLVTTGPRTTTRGGEELAAWDYLRRMGPLGHFGPVGAYGPIGTLGPVGGKPWNPDLYVSGVVPWSDWSELLTREGGPLSAEGPLGSKGPLNPTFWDELPATLRTRIEASDLSTEAKARLVQILSNDFVAHLKPGGVFGLLGPTGISGALGPLGPLGTIGAHGYVAEDGGAFVPNEGRCHHAPDGFETPPCRKIDVEWTRGGDRRTYDLFEVYDKATAQSFDGSAPTKWNDTSFMVKARVASVLPDEYLFRSETAQWVSIAVVPETARYSFRQAIQPHLACNSILESATRAEFEPPAWVYMPIRTALTRCTLVPYDHRGSHDDFDLELVVEHRGKSASIASRSRDMVDWIEVKVPAGAVLRARVNIARPWLDPLIPRLAPAPYRLVVVGSGPNARSSTTFEGPYLDRLTLR